MEIISNETIGTVSLGVGNVAIEFVVVEKEVTVEWNTSKQNSETRVGVITARRQDSSHYAKCVCLESISVDFGTSNNINGNNITMVTSINTTEQFCGDLRQNVHLAWINKTSDWTQIWNRQRSETRNRHTTITINERFPSSSSTSRLIQNNHCKNQSEQVKRVLYWLWANPKLL